MTQAFCLCSCMFLLAAVLRVGWVTYRYAGDDQAAQLEYPDEEAYVHVARSLHDGSGLKDEFGFRAAYMPGYPAFLAVFQSRPRPLLWTRLAQALLAALIAPATMWLAYRLQVGPAGAVLAGLAAAVDPFLVFFSGLLLTEALFAVVLVAAWAAMAPMIQSERRISSVQPLLAGGLLLAGILFRPSAVILLPAVLIALPALRRADRDSLKAALIIAAVVIAGLCPWAMRNQRLIGSWTWLTIRGGISLYDGVRPAATGASDLAHTRSMPEITGFSEVEWDAYFKQQAWTAIRDEPGRVAGLALRKLARTWSPVPNVEQYRRGLTAIVGAVWTIVLLLLAAWGCIRRPEPRVLFFVLLPVLAFTLLHMIYVGSVRYRVPVMPLLMVLASFAAGGNRWRRAASTR